MEYNLTINLLRQEIERPSVVHLVNGSLWQKMCDDAQNVDLNTYEGMLFAMSMDYAIERKNARESNGT